MKKILLVLLCGVFVQTANAQLLKFGVKAGVGSSSISGADITSPVTTGSFDQLKMTAEGASFGVHFGLMSRINIPLLPLMVQPELLFTSAGGRYTIEDLSNPSLKEEGARQTFNRVDVPVLVGLKMGPARLMLGPVASFILSEGFSSESFNTVSTDAKTATFGIQAGVGVDILGKLAFDLRYEGGLSRFGDEITVAGTALPLDGRTNQVLFSVGYFFGGK